MSIKRQALRTWRAVKGMKADNPSSGALVSMASTLTLRSDAPPVDRYQAWLDAGNAPKAQGGSIIDARTLRRMVQCRRNGLTCEEIGTVVGMSATPVSKWLRKLPEELK